MHILIITKQKKEIRWVVKVVDTDTDRSHPFLALTEVRPAGEHMQSGERVRTWAVVDDASYELSAEFTCKYVPERNAKIGVNDVTRCSSIGDAWVQYPSFSSDGTYFPMSRDNKE